MSIEVTGGVVVVRDETAPVDAGRGCTAITPHEVSCEGLRARVSLHDGDDRLVTVEGGGATVDGGGGADVLDAGAGDDALAGGAGNDELHGRGGSDTLSGNGGRDLLAGGPGDDRFDGDGDFYDPKYDEPRLPATDQIRGGPGVDVVGYFERETPLRIDLRRGRAGEAGEGDEVVDVENAFGGAGDDRMIGTNGRNHLSGGAGDDSLSGGRGDDQLDGGRGLDRVRAGRGNDEVAGSGDFNRLFPEPGDLIRCGPGRDIVVQPNARDQLGRQCDWADAGSDFSDDLQVSVRPVRTGPGGVLVFRVRCVRPEQTARACRGKITLHYGRGGFRPITAFRRFAVPRGRTRGVSFDLPRRAVSRLRRPRALLQVRVRVGDRICGSFCHKGWRTRVTPRR